MVVDASFALRLLVPNVDTEAAHRHWKSWYRDGRSLLAPAHWPVEITSGLHRLQWAGELTAREVETALGRAFELGVDLLPINLELSRAALGWAGRLDQSKAYDAYYLALAEVAKADLWTADLRLARRARQLGIEWVHALGD